MVSQIISTFATSENEYRKKANLNNKTIKKMKNYFHQCLLLLMLLFAGVTQSYAQAPSSAIGNEYRVGNELEFLSALASGHTIVLKAGTHLNLSDVLDNKDLFDVHGRAYVSDASAFPRDGQERIASEDVFDGRQLTLVNIHDLTIRGENDCSIVVEPRYAFVLNFIGCNNISIECLTLGHTEEGYCTGGVIGMEHCDVMTIESCDMYGCGTYGIEARHTQVLRMFRSIIRDCSYGIMELGSVSDAIFLLCDFYRNREFGLITADAGCSQIIFDDCRFAENEGELFVFDTKVRMEGCVIHHAKGGFGPRGAIQ